MLNLHVYPSPLTHESRMLKETEAIASFASFDRVVLVGAAAQGLPDRAVIDARREVVRISRDAPPWLPGSAGKVFGVAVWTFRVLRRFRNEPLACINCHTTQRAPTLGIAGTVYGALHEGDDCYGSPGVSVVITGADGRVTTLTTNESGNFSLRSRGTIALPFRAKIVSGSQERVMATPQMNGDCSSCHSAAGAEGAAGRITL